MSSPPVSQRKNLLARVWSAVPFRAWLIVAGMIGGIVGLGAFTFAYAEGGSYLSDDPSACVNCHVMRDQYDGWHQGSHTAVATCNDCHTPHDSVIAKYAVKGLNGYRHSAAFTLGNYHVPIRITDLNHNVAQQSCIYCHGSMTSQISHTDTDDPTDCLRCHSGVGHR